MKTIDNKFEIGEECYTYTRENVEIVCTVCKGTKKILYNEYNFTAAFAVASVLVIFAIIILIVRNYIEWRSKKKISAV